MPIWSSNACQPAQAPKSSANHGRACPARATRTDVRFRSMRRSLGQQRGNDKRHSTRSHFSLAAGSCGHLSEE